MVDSKCNEMQRTETVTPSTRTSDLRETPRATPTMVWRKPHRVTIDDGYLVADPSQEAAYPIFDAADGRALRALSDAHTDEGACAFTTRWGFLHARFEGGQWDRFPLALFRLHRQYFLALVRLCEAVRTRPHDRTEIGTALLALKTSRAARDTSLYPSPDARSDPLHAALQSFGITEGRTLEDSLTADEQALVDQGVPTTELVMARGEGRGTLDLAEYAARTVASELGAGLSLRSLRPVWCATGKGRQQGYWEFEDVPIMISLEQVLRWSVRSWFHVLHHYVCESCGREAIASRADERFCSEACGTRMRVARWRARKAAEKHKAAARRSAARRSARSTQSTKRRGRQA